VADKSAQPASVPGGDLPGRVRYQPGGLRRSLSAGSASLRVQALCAGCDPGRAGGVDHGGRAGGHGATRSGRGGAGGSIHPAARVTVCSLLRPRFALWRWPRVSEIRIDSPAEPQGLIPQRTRGSILPSTREASAPGRTLPSSLIDNCAHSRYNASQDFVAARGRSRMKGGEER
jgi:hypothetical protein